MIHLRRKIRRVGGHVADVTVGAALRQGVITHDGKAEAVTGW